MTYETIIYDLGDNIATITLNRPEKLNAFTGQMMEELINAFDRGPPSAKYTGYLSSLADPYGRQSYLRVDARF